MAEPISVFSTLSKQDKLKARKKAYKLWSKNPQDRNPRRMNKIAREVGMTRAEFAYYMNKDKWIERYNNDHPNSQLGKVETILGVESEDSLLEIEDILDRSGLAERQKLFILFYLQNYNGALAAIQAGYPPKNYSVYAAILQNDKVHNTLKKIKNVVRKEIYVTGHDVLDQYVRIGFADITNFIEFDGNKVTLKSSDVVDGSLISEIKQGKDGITFKLHDKLKALDKLEKLFDVIPDKRLQLDQEKFEFTKEIANREVDGDDNVRTVIINDIG